MLKSENKFYKNLQVELKKAVVSEINEAKKLIRTEMPDIAKMNTELRKHLDRFVLIGLIYEKIQGLSFYELSRLSDKCELRELRASLFQILPKRLSKYGYQKEEVTELLEAIDWNALICDLKVISPQV